MTAVRRWCVVALGVLLVVATPVLLRAVPATGSDVSAATLLHRVKASRTVPYSGYVESAGTLQLSVTDRFSDLTDLLSGTSRLRVWWGGPDRWRVDTLRTTGETDLFHDGDGTTSWSYESERATRSRTVPIRLPDASDLLPPALAHRALAGAKDREVSRIDERRIAGRSVPGLRYDPAGTRSRVDHVDIWADARTGLALRTDVYAIGDRQPSVRTAFESVTTTRPSVDTMLFVPPPNIGVRFDQAVDIAAAADRFSRQRPPQRLAGMQRRDGIGSFAVGIYGRGVNAMMAVPLWGRAARPLREQLSKSVGATVDDAGVHLGAGPLGLLLTPGDLAGGSWLLAGTVADATLTRAAADLAAEQSGRR